MHDRGTPEPVGRAPATAWGAFTLVCGAYLAVTVGEQMLSPVFPAAADELSLSEAQGGIAFGTLAGSIAVFNLVGGALVRRRSVVAALRVAAVLTTAGSIVAAVAPGFVVLVGAQVLLGAGAGCFFPAGLQAVAAIAGRRKGFAMGLFGVAFSVGLTIAALIGALGAQVGWRAAFWCAAALAVVSGLSTAALHLPAGPERRRGRVPLRSVMGLPTTVGAVGAICQYGAVPFLTTFAVTEWGLTAAGAAALLAAGRLLSIVAKLVSGASADRVGVHSGIRSTAVVIAVTGLGWVLLPASWPTYALAAVFAGTISSLFPLANLLAIQQFGGDGAALGMYRSVQVAFGAVVGASIGLAGEVVGLRTTLGLAVALPLFLVHLCRDRTPAPTPTPPATP